MGFKALERIESSPHMWGCFHDGLTVGPRKLVFPTRVGCTTKPPSSRSGAPSFLFPAAHIGPISFIRKSITVCSISICLPAGRTPRRAACPGRCPHESTSGPARCAGTRLQATLEGSRNGNGNPHSGCPRRNLAYGRRRARRRRPCCASDSGRRKKGGTGCPPNRGPHQASGAGRRPSSPCPRRTRTCSGIRPGRNGAREEQP